jgi:hypothetical protein
LRGYLRSENVSDIVGLWKREDGDNPAPAFNNMPATQLKGITDWTVATLVQKNQQSATAKGIADVCVGHRQNFHDLFRLPAPQHWLSAR